MRERRKDMQFTGILCVLVWVLMCVCVCVSLCICVGEMVEMGKGDSLEPLESVESQRKTLLQVQAPGDVAKVLGVQLVLLGQNLIEPPAHRSRFPPRCR